MLGLWNNFHERAALEQLHQPEHPLYFVKTPNSYAGEGDPIPRPAGYTGAVVFEGELGIVIGQRCKDITLEPGDLIACGTSVGVRAMQDGETVEVVIPEVGSLTNRFG